MQETELQKKQGISQTAGKKVLEIMFQTGESPLKIIERLNLWQMEPKEVCYIAYLTVCEHPELALKYLDGNEKVINALMGKVMGKINGRSTGTWVEECVVASIEYIYAAFLPKKPTA